jgi:cell division septation protein DedD
LQKSLNHLLELSDHSPEGLSQPPGLPKSDDADADNIPAVIDIHTVHAGTFQSAFWAKELVEELKALGYPSFMYMKTSEEKTEYIVVAGKYQSYTSAKKASLKLNNNGYNNFIAKAKDSLKRGPAILINQQPVGSDAGKEDAN